MLTCTPDKEYIRQYLTSSLKRLHLTNESTVDMLESAVVEGGIIEIEMMWIQLLGEDPPNKLTVLGRDKTKLD